MSTFLRRNAEPWITELLTYFPVVILQGGRQVGKSTLAGEIAIQNDGHVITMDNDNARASAATDPAGFLSLHASTGAREPLVIDEIQRAPELFLAIKESVDADRRPGTPCERMLPLTCTASSAHRTVSPDALSP